MTKHSTSDIENFDLTAFDEIKSKLREPQYIISDINEQRIPRSLTTSSSPIIVNNYQTVPLRGSEINRLENHQTLNIKSAEFDRSESPQPLNLKGTEIKRGEKYITYITRSPNTVPNKMVVVSEFNRSSRSRSPIHGEAVYTNAPIYNDNNEPIFIKESIYKEKDEAIYVNDVVYKEKRSKQKRDSRKSAAFYAQLTEDERQSRGRELMNARSREYRRRQKEKGAVYEQLYTEEEKRNKSLTTSLKRVENEMVNLERAINEIDNLAILEPCYNN